MEFTKIQQQKTKTFKAKLRHVHVTTAAGEKQKVLLFVSVCLYLCLSYAPCSVHAPYMSSVVCLVIPHILALLHQTVRFSEKKSIQHKTCVLIFSTNFMRGIRRSKENLARYYQKWKLVFM